MSKRPSTISGRFKPRAKTPKGRFVAWKKHLAQQYHITPALVQAMDIDQGGVCLICGERPDKWLVVDHDHLTGAIRGLLCKDCNYGLGCFKDRPDLLMAAATYLRPRGVV